MCGESWNYASSPLLEYVSAVCVYPWGCICICDCLPCVCACHIAYASTGVHAKRQRVRLPHPTLAAQLDLIPSSVGRLLTCPRCDAPPTVKERHESSRFFLRHFTRAPPLTRLVTSALRSWRWSRGQSHEKLSVGNQLIMLSVSPKETDSSICFLLQFYFSARCKIFWASGCFF